MPARVAGIDVLNAARKSWMAGPPPPKVYHASRAGMSYGPQARQARP